MATSPPKPATWSYSEAYVPEDEVLQAARARAQEVGVAPIGSGGRRCSTSTPRSRVQRHFGQLLGRDEAGAHAVVDVVGAIGHFVADVDEHRGEVRRQPVLDLLVLKRDERDMVVAVQGYSGQL